MNKFFQLRTLLSRHVEKFHFRKINPRKFAIILSITVLLVTFGYVAINSGPLSPTKVTTLKINNESIQPMLFGIGTVEARRSYLMGPVVAGRVLNVYVETGDLVKKGQLLAEMDSVDLKERMTSILAQLDDANARFLLASQTAKRYIELGKENFISQIVVDGKIQELNSAKAIVNKFKADLASLKQQELNMQLKAPVDGVIISRDAEPGSTVIAGQTVLKMIDPTSLWIKTRFDQGKSMGLNNGLEANITLRSSPNRLIKGKVIRVEIVSDSIAEERIAQVEMIDAPKTVSIGEMAEVVLQLTPTESYLTLPNASIKKHQNQIGVWLLKDGKPKFTQVKISPETSSDQVIIESGINANDEVIIYSDAQIKENSRIKVVDALQKKFP